MTYEPVRQTSTGRSVQQIADFGCEYLDVQQFEHQLFLFHAVSSGSSVSVPHPVRAQRSEWPHCFPRKEQYCPRSPVNWLITSLMRVQQPATMATLSDSQVTSEPKTRTCLIWENGLGADKIPEHGAAGENGPLMDGNH